MVRRTLPALLLTLLLAGCISESPNPVVFDQTIESVTFENRLFAPVVLFRNGVILDTLPARVERTYRIDEKGVFRHAWQLVPARNDLGATIGVAPRIELGIQYGVNESYRIANSTNAGTLFTPRILNLSINTVQWTWVNFQVSNQESVNRAILANSVTTLDHAPYFFWNFSSNVVISDPSRGRVYFFRRGDTTDSGDPELEIDDDLQFSGGGVTQPIEIR